jgi:hypothetical protein
VLLLAASRRKGEIVPGVRLGILGHPAFAIGVYLLSLSGLLLYGLVIWQDPLPRVVALATGAVVIGMPLVMTWRGTFAPRAVVEVRRSGGPQEATAFNLVGAGKPISIPVVLETAKGEQRWQTPSEEGPVFSQLRRITFELPGGDYRDVKVWAYQVMPDEESQALPAILEVDSAQDAQRYDLRLSRGQVIFPASDQGMRIRLQFEGM